MPLIGFAGLYGNIRSMARMHGENCVANEIQVVGSGIMQSGNQASAEYEA